MMEIPRRFQEKEVCPECGRKYRLSEFRRKRDLRGEQASVASRNGHVTRHVTGFRT